MLKLLKEGGVFVRIRGDFSKDDKNKIYFELKLMIEQEYSSLKPS